MIPVAALLGALLAALGLRIALARRRAGALPEPLQAPPPTAILLPLRDEEENAEGCLDSLLRQSAPGRVVAIDDHSSDGTARLLSEIAARSPRLEARSAPELPPGWGGKVHALSIGAHGATEPWLLTTDADTRHDADLLARAHAAAAEHGLDALSLAGRQETAGLIEGLVVPAVFVLLDALLGDWRAHERGDARSPVANGQYFLLRRVALDAIGGFTAIAGHPLDDVELARALSAGGWRVGFRRAGGALRIRMYRGARAVLSGWRRNLALFVAPRTAVALAALLLLLAPPLVAAVALVAGAPLAAVAIWAGGAAGSALGRGRHGRPLLALLYPADSLLVGITLLAAVADRSRGRLRPWRGRAIATTPAETPAQRGSAAR